MQIRGYAMAGGRLLFDNPVFSEVEYAHQLNNCQDLIERELLSRVDVVRAGTTELIGSMVKQEDRIKKKMGELMLAGLKP